MAAKLAKRCIHIGPWTAFSIRVFRNILWHLRGRHSALIYLVLYHYAWHDKRKQVHATLATVAKWSGLDYRTVQLCIQELEFRRFIRRTSPGTPRSHQDVPVWEVPAAKFDMRKKGWVPVPSFIITRYLPAHPACVLLPVFLYYQNLRKENTCYPGTLELTQRIGWSVKTRRRVYDAIRLMGNKKNWRALGTGLPRPLEILRTEFTKASRHFSVRAIYYHHEKKCGPPELFLTKEFTRFFKVGYKKKRG